jgi:predicted amidohydrolase
MFIANLALAGEVTFTLAGLRVTPMPWDKQANLVTLERYAMQAVADGAQLVITPEGCLEGYVWNQYSTKNLQRDRYFEVAETIDGPIMSQIRHLVKELKIHLVVGFAERRDEKMYNSVVIFSPDGDIITRYSKMHTANDEPYNTKGNEFSVVDTLLGRWGTLIFCLDRQLTETSRHPCSQGSPNYSGPRGDVRRAERRHNASPRL